MPFLFPMALSSTAPYLLSESLWSTDDVKKNLYFQQELYDFFIPGEDFVYYESPADAIEKAAYFLSHGRERQEIAHNAFEKIAASHTFHHRVQSMFELI